MDKIPLIQYPAKELLAKFGMGSHKPGSGSAAAFQAMLAAQLVRTVISITGEERYKDRYAEVLAPLKSKDDDIVNRIYPALERLFEQDAILFDKVIVIRRSRDNASDKNEKLQLAKDADQALKNATDILIQIADNCADVADYAAFVFDNAFTGAKGDTGMALNGSVAAFAGCLTIIDLNLSLLSLDDWMIDLRQKLNVLRVDYENLAKATRSRMENYTIDSYKKSFEKSKKGFDSARRSGVRVSYATIELLVEEARNLLWNYRDLIWENNTPQTELEILKPEVVLEKILGYKFGYASLGGFVEGDVEFQTTGQINNVDRSVYISNQLNGEVKNFTIAHELGHAMLHSDMSDLHRDRPVVRLRGTKDIKEIEADNFAACFLMPPQLVKDVFIRIFGIEKFSVNDNSLFKLSGLRPDEFKKKYRDLHSAAKFVAIAKRSTFQPIHKIFGVSIEAMAIRLEHLDLVEYSS